MVKLSNRVFAIWCFLVITAPSTIFAECSVSTNDAIAYKIAHGHAWTNHGGEFSEKKKIANIEISDADKSDTPEEFQHHILMIMGSMTPKTIPGNRKVYWDDKSGTIIFVDPYSNDCGTAFRPNDGKEYYERVLNRKESDKDHSKMEANQNRIFEQHKNQNRGIHKFQCDGRTLCSQMRSCEEATFFLQNCPNTKMDGNNDGIPCEKQWCK